MAKISARGDSEHARWRHPDTGAELVLTMAGRLLIKRVRGGSYVLACAGRVRGIDGARPYAERYGMERV